jgi:hypothetical protein
MMLLRAAVIAALPLALHAPQPERITLDGREIAVYNLVGRLHAEAGTGDRVVVEVTRGGRDAARLKLETGNVRGRMALRIQYPSDRIYYSDSRWNGRSSFSVSDDGTFGDENDHGRRSERRRIEVSSRDDGLDAHADLHVLIPKGKRIFLRQGIGETTIENIEGSLDVTVAAAHSRVSHIRGSLRMDTGSGGVELTDITGDVDLDSGSGGATIDGIHGTRLTLDVGSGSLRGRGIEVDELTADVGSGGVRLSAVKAPRLHMETGSGGTDIEMLSAPSDVSIEGGSGGVTLRVPAALDATVDIETGSGGIDSDFEVKVSRMERHALRGTIGGGKGRIKIEAGSGSVRLLRS